MPDPPSDVIFPPLVAEDLVTSVISFVVKAGKVGVSSSLLQDIMKTSRPTKTINT
jgi:hypothetical protein